MMAKTIARSRRMVDGIGSPHHEGWYIERALRRARWRYLVARLLAR